MIICGIRFCVENKKYKQKHTQKKVLPHFSNGRNNEPTNGFDVNNA